LQSPSFFSRAKATVASTTYSAAGRRRMHGRILAKYPKTARKKGVEGRSRRETSPAGGVCTITPAGRRRMQNIPAGRWRMHNSPRRRLTLPAGHGPVYACRGPGGRP
jgi:hypothetical protein